MIENHSHKPKLLLGCCGSVATIKIPELYDFLDEYFEIRLIATTSALIFLTKPALVEEYKYDKNAEKWKRTDPVLHIELRAWADCMLIAPLSANTLAKLANGLCDNLVTLICRCWDFKKPIWVCPAMNSFMWDHPITHEQINKIKEWGYRCIGPVEKLLACGEYGVGGMSAVEDIKKIVIEEWKIKTNLEFKKTEKSIYETITN